MTQAIVQQVREASAARRTLRIRGAGTWLAAGRPIGDAELVSTGDDRGIVEYVPGDLTLTARAGTRLAEIAAATGAHGQWLPLDPWGGDDGTLGATVSTASAGPHAHAMGLPRDTVLGVEFVTGAGEVVRSGGRVVKNVAGFDLTRLLVGSWGTLGVLTEVTVRLRARPERTRTVVLSVDVSTASLSGLATRLRALPFTPLAAELVNDTLASRLDMTGGAMLIVQLGGNERAIGAQLDSLRDLGAPRDGDDAVWPRLRAACGGGKDAAAWRCSRLPAEFGNVWQSAADAARPLGRVLIHGNPGRGVARVIVPGELISSIDASVIAAATRADATVAIESLPSAAWRFVPDRPSSGSLSTAIRHKFDPAGILNAGILGDAA